MIMFGSEKYQEKKKILKKMIFFFIFGFTIKKIYKKLNIIKINLKFIYF